MHNDLLQIKDMIDLVVREASGLTHLGVVKEMEYISNFIKTTVDQEIAEFEKHMEQQAYAFELYDDSVMVANG